MLSTLASQKRTYFVLTFYFLIFIWFGLINSASLRESDLNYAFGVIYAFIALFGGISGLLIARKWGGIKSAVGRGISFFSLGLLGQFFGQVVWSYFNIVAKVEVPYPSVADIGFFSIIPFYSLGMLSFAKAAGAKFSLKRLDGKIYALAFPLIIVAIVYFVFIRDLVVDFSDPIKTFFDFGYPLGESIALSIAIVTYFLARGVLGGHMRSRIAYLAFALTFQFITEFTFIYRAANESYYNAGPVDLMYATSFVLMSLGLLSFRDIET